MYVSTAANCNTRLAGDQLNPENRQNKRKKRHDTPPSKRVRLDTAHTNHQGLAKLAKLAKKEGLQKKLPEYQVTIAKNQPVQQNTQKSKLQIDTQHRADSHSIPLILNNVLADIRKMDIEYAIYSDKSIQMPEHKRLPVHGNLVCVDKIYTYLLVPEIHHLIQRLSLIKDLKQQQADYATQIAALVKKYKVAQCDEMAHLMASLCLHNPAISLFKMVISFFRSRTPTGQGKLDQSTTHVCLMVCPHHSGQSILMHSQWYEAQYKGTHTSLLCADGSYHQPSYISTSDIYIADPCQDEYWPGNQWQQFISSITDQYITPTGKDYKKIKVQITPYHSETAVKESPVAKAGPVKRKSKDCTALPAYRYLETFAGKAKKEVKGEKQRAIPTAKKRLVRDDIEIPSWDTIKPEHRNKWTASLIRVLAWKMNLKITVFFHDDLSIIDPGSEDYYQFMLELLRNSKLESARDFEIKSTSFNTHGFPFPEPCKRYFFPSEIWLPDHIRHLTRVAKPEKPLSDCELIKVLRVLNPVESPDTYLRYLHEYIQNKLVNNHQGTAVLANAISTLRKGKLPLPAIAGITSWNMPTLRNLANFCAEKFGGVSVETVAARPSVGKKDVIPSSPDEFSAWFLKKLTNNQFIFNNFSGKLKASNLIVNISPIKGITFNTVPQKSDWLLYYVYHYGFDKKEIYLQAPSHTLYQMLKRITSREKHSELFNRILYVCSTWCGFRSFSFINSLKKHNIKRPDDLLDYPVTAMMIEMHARAEKLKESGWLAADIDLSNPRATGKKARASLSS